MPKNHPFEIGERYQNDRGDYEVLAIDGERMRIRYADGGEQTVKVELQARIWQRKLDESRPKSPQFNRRDFDSDHLATAPIRDLVADVLQARFKAPFPDDITDQVCLAIENEKAFLERYESLVKQFSKGDYEPWRVNNWIGQWTKDLTGMVNIQEGIPAKSRLIESYSRLGYESLESK